MVKSLREFEYFTVFLKNRNFTSKIKRSKVTDYAALSFSKYFLSNTFSLNIDNWSVAFSLLFSIH